MYESLSYRSCCSGLRSSSSGGRQYAAPFLLTLPWTQSPHQLPKLPKLPKTTEIDSLSALNFEFATKLPAQQVLNLDFLAIANSGIYFCLLLTMNLSVRLLLRVL